MADKKEETKIVLERTYNVPLRKGFQTAPKYKRAKKAMNVLKEFLTKHMKPTELKIGSSVNLNIWKHGIKNPPHHVNVDVTKDDKGTVVAELVGAKKVRDKKSDAKPKSAEKKPEVKPEAKKVDDKPKAETKVETKTETKPVEKKVVENKPAVKAETKPAAPAASVASAASAEKKPEAKPADKPKSDRPTAKDIKKL